MMSSKDAKAPFLGFTKGIKQEELEEAVKRLLDAILFEVFKHTDRTAEQLELLAMLKTIVDERIETIVKGFRKEHCGIPCDHCTENKHCQIGVYQARKH